MKMELIQPFINAADAVLGSGSCSMPASELATFMAAESSTKVASSLAGMELEPDPQLIRESVSELANMVIGNAITNLNDQGFRFRVHPPVDHSSGTGFRGSKDIEALVMDFESPVGSVVMNVAIQYNSRRRGDRSKI